MNPKYRLLLVCLVVLVGITGLLAQAPEGDRERGIKARPLADPVASDPEVPTQPEPAPLGEAAVLRLIRFSGALRPEASGLGQPRTGTVGITFALYKEQSGGSPLWLETQNVELGAEGRYTVLLGSTHNEGLPLEIFASEEARWLEVTVQGEDSSLPAAGRPRILLVSVPYALKAADAERLGGKPAEAFLLAAPSGEESEKSGSGQGKTLSKGGDGTLAQVVSGTVGQIAKFTATDTVQDSIITETGGGDIGVGTTTPGGKLHVQKTGAETRLVVGNPTPVGNNASDGRIQIFGEHNGVVKSAFIHNIGSSLQINGAGAGVNVQLVGAFETSILNGTSLGIYSPTNAKRVYVRHDGSQALINTFGSGAGGIAVRPGTDVTTAFQVQRSFGAGATPILSVDSVNSRVGIGTTTPGAALEVAGQVKITGGSPGVGKVLTSDADGLASWQAASGVPSGVIVMWSGSLASIPSGWALCDGANGTPDLRSRFIMGVATAENPGATGGFTSHSHAVNSHTHSVDPAVVQSSGPQEPSSDVTAGSGVITIAVVPANHTHTVDTPSTTTTSNGSTTDSQDHLPPFFKLAFIMKL